MVKEFLAPALASLISVLCTIGIGFIRTILVVGILVVGFSTYAFILFTPFVLLGVLTGLMTIPISFNCLIGISIAWLIFISYMVGST